MKKEIVICDDCGKTIVAAYQSINNKDICPKCLDTRLKQSFLDYPVGSLGIKCTHCNGDGQTKDFFGHNDYSLATCVICHGTGTQPWPPKKND